ncbi:hypothetical protein [Haematomicrobium sanguinis]|uniref:hypothetical protein n=1 Tax=Haematomicrobium sanguinis TaxID=479106 RepID=UPI0004789539|nr:hypothetical protein [Haematomicrobium sanguinis]
MKILKVLEFLGITNSDPKRSMWQVSPWGSAAALSLVVAVPFLVFGAWPVAITFLAIGVIAAVMNHHIRSLY